MIKLGVAGDWHGNRRWALHSIDVFADAGVGEIYQLGDFGVWPGPMGREYLLDLQAALAGNAMRMFVTPGNHEDYDQIAELPALDLGHDIGEVLWITDNIALLPRGHRWSRGGWSFVSLGGAPSVDLLSRRMGVDWWAGEAITDDDVARTVGGGPADVMLTHDAPDAALGAPGVAAILRSNPMGWPAKALLYAAEGRARMTTAFLGVEPRLFIHGHYHLKDETWIEKFDHPTHVVSLDSDGLSDGNLAIVTLPDRESGDEPDVEWLSTPPGDNQDRDRESAPKAPISEWTLDDVVKVLNEGRSVHWRALARVHRRDDSPFGILLTEALTLTTNQAARDYLHRVLSE